MSQATQAEQIQQLFTRPRSQRVKPLFGFDAFPYQGDLLDEHERGGVTQAAVKPGRQVGKTLTGGAIAADEFVQNSDVMILGPYEDTVREMMDEFKNHIHELQGRLAGSPVSLTLETDNELELESASGGRCRARTVGTTGAQIRGKNPDVVLVDEAAYIKDRVFTEVIEPFFSTHDSWQFYMFSTPAGTSGYFYDAVEGQYSDDWYSPHWPSSISPLISDELLKKRREQLDSVTYQQEYEGEFVDEGDSYLPHKLVKPCVVDSTELSGDTWLGVDVARKGKDRTVYMEIDRSGNVNVVDSEETSTVPGVAGRIKHLHEQNQYEGVYVDENAVGGGVVDDEGLTGIVTGVTFSTKTKHQMYQNLKQAFESQGITLPNHRRLITELTGLEFSFTANGYVKVHHREGGHDDFADALALANYGRQSGNTVVRRKGITTRKRNLNS